MGDTNDLQISIVVACLNAASTLPACLESVRSQELGRDVEIVFADGGSDDDSRAIAGHYGAVVLPGGDTGLYQGMNRGIAAASGNYILLLNADDVLPEGALSHYCQAFAMAPDRDMYSGGAEVFGQIVTSYAPKRPLSLAGALFGVPVPNARIYARETLESLGGFREDVGLAADRFLLVSLAAKGVTGVALQGQVYRYQSHAGSLTLAADGGARSRVHQADNQLVEHLRSIDVPEHLILAYRQLQRLRLEGLSSLKGPSDVLNLARALRNWARWRGQMVGY